MVTLAEECGDRRLSSCDQHEGATKADIMRIKQEAGQTEEALMTFVVLVVDGDAFTAVLAPCT